MDRWLKFNAAKNCSTCNTVPRPWFSILCQRKVCGRSSETPDERQSRLTAMYKEFFPGDKHLEGQETWEALEAWREAQAQDIVRG